MNISELTSEIANSYAKQVDQHLQLFLRKNLVPFDGDIVKTMGLLKEKGMMLIREDEPLDGFGDRTTIYRLLRIIDSTTVTIKAPKLMEQS